MSTLMKRVLIVEDEPLVAFDLADTIAGAGYAVVGPAASVAEALRIIAREGCDAAVLDINLAGQSSEPVAAALAARGTRFIGLSGYTMKQAASFLKNAPMLSKPVSTADLLRAIARLVHKGERDPLQSTEDITG